MTNKADQELITAVAMSEAMTALNDGVTEMLITGSELPSVNASLRVANAVRRLHRSLHPVARSTIK
jgi:hypothetical protein